jgi:type I restriction enzyme S subunit
LTALARESIAVTSNSVQRKGASEIFSVPSAEIHSGAHRLESSFYGSDGYQAVAFLKRSGFELVKLGTVADVEWPGIFARQFVTDASRGVPFLTTSDILEARPMAHKFISRARTDRLAEILARPGIILVSRSGTIGNVVLCTKDHDGFAVTDDALRVLAKDPLDQGTLYAFLQSDAGQFLLCRNTSGSVVEHIYSDDVASLPFPVFPRALRKEITHLIHHASSLRVDSNALLWAAQSAICEAHDYIEPPDAIEDELEYFSKSSAQLYTSYESRQRIRLEASFHMRRATLAEDAVRRTKTAVRLADAVAGIPYTGPGTQPGVAKVAEGNGVPCITGRDLCLARPRPSSFILSPKKRLIEMMKTDTGTTLVMCAGTLGIADYVRRNYETWAVSLDVIRVIPNPQLLHAGYVFAFLSCGLGKAQMLRHRYGSVIPRIHSRQVAEILISIPKDKGDRIGALVDQAFDKRAEAVSSENRAISLLSDAIIGGRRKTESHWGKEY